MDEWVGVGVGVAGHDRVTIVHVAGGVVEDGLGTGI